MYDLVNLVVNLNLKNIAHHELHYLVPILKNFDKTMAAFHPALVL